MQKNKTHISNCWETRTKSMSQICTYTPAFPQQGIITHAPGLTEPLAKPCTLLVPPPPEPDLNSSFWPTGLLTQRPHISLRHKGNDLTVPLFPRYDAHSLKLHKLYTSTKFYSLVSKVWLKKTKKKHIRFTVHLISATISKHFCWQ